MKTLTQEQAELFRRLRPTLRPLCDAANALVGELLTACPHLEENDPDCEVCKLYEAARDAEAALHGIPDEVDAALLRGPLPASRQKARDKKEGRSRG